MLGFLFCLFIFSQLSNIKLKAGDLILANLEKISSLYIKDSKGNLVEKYSLKDEDATKQASENTKKINELNETIGEVDTLIDEINGEPVFDNEGSDDT